MSRRTLLLAVVPPAPVAPSLIAPNLIAQTSAALSRPAGAPVQPHFMPSAHRPDAVHVEGNSRRDIRTSTRDKLASIANADDSPGAHRPATQADRQTRIPIRTHPSGCIRWDPAVQSSPVKF